MLAADVPIPTEVQGEGKEALMVTVHPAELDALHARIDTLERELQHKREIISRILDREAKANARAATLEELLRCL